MHASHRQRLVALSTKPRRVEVEWIDSAGHSGWTTATELLSELEFEDRLKCYSCGFLVAENDEHVTIALSYTIDAATGLHGEYGEAVTIPRVAIVDLRDLRR